jgi:hypothetical protein
LMDKAGICCLGMGGWQWNKYMNGWFDCLKKKKGEMMDKAETYCLVTGHEWLLLTNGCYLSYNR